MVLSNIIISLGQFYAVLNQHVILAASLISNHHCSDDNTSNRNMQQSEYSIGTSKVVGNRLKLPGVGKRLFLLFCIYEIWVTVRQRDLGHLYISLLSLSKVQIRARRNALLVIIGLYPACGLFFITHSSFSVHPGIQNLFIYLFLISIAPEYSKFKAYFLF